MSKDFNETVPQKDPISLVFRLAAGTNDESNAPAGCREKWQKSRAAELGATLSPGTCDGADHHRAMSTLRPASGIDTRFVWPAAQSAGLQVTFGRQQFHAARHCCHCELAAAVPTVLSVQHAAKLGKCTRDTEHRDMCAVRACVAYVIQLYGQINSMKIPERRPSMYDLIRHVLGTVERRLC
jgi:hypothetical protein